MKSFFFGLIVAYAPLFAAIEAIIFDFHGVIVDKEPDSIKPKAFMVELVLDLKERGYRVGLLSNASSRRAAMGQALNLYELFDPALLACEIGLSKPDPKAFLLLLALLDLSAEKVLFIDDELENVQAACALGIQGIFFKPEGFKELLDSKLFDSKN